MKKKHVNNYVLVIITIFLVTFSNTSVSSHSGGTDNLGGHYVRTSGHGYTVGTYHYHSGPYAGYTVSEKGEIPAAFRTNTPDRGRQKSASSFIDSRTIFFIATLFFCLRYS